MAKIVTVTWTDSTGNTVAPTHHIVERKTGSGGTYAQLGSNIANGTQSYVDSSALVDSQEYYYRVGAVFASGNTIYIEANITISAASAETVLFDTDTDNFTDFTAVGDVTFTYLNSRWQIANPANAGASVVTLLTNKFTPAANFIIDHTYKMEVTVFAADAIHIGNDFKVSYPLTGITMVSDIIAVGVLESTILGASNGSFNLSFDGDGTDFAGEEIDISRIRIIDLGVV